MDSMKRGVISSMSIMPLRTSFWNSTSSALFHLAVFSDDPATLGILCDNRVILNGQFGCGGGGAGVGRGAVEAWWRRGGHKGHDSLKLEKDGSLAKCASGATKIDR